MNVESGPAKTGAVTAIATENTRNLCMTRTPIGLGGTRESKPGRRQRADAAKLRLRARHESVRPITFRSRSGQARFRKSCKGKIEDYGGAMRRSSSRSLCSGY